MQWFTSARKPAKPMAGARGTGTGHSKIRLSEFRIAMKTYVCIVCGFVYDEAIGRPEDGIKAGTRWEDIPADWACPDCGVAKADFELVEV
jgi:rubredoxin